MADPEVEVRNEPHVRHESTARRVELSNRAYGYVCPHCAQRFAGDLIEMHVLIAHGRAFA